MKKRKFSKFNIFKSKKGLTYVELLTALALLSLIIVSFTPMLLQSYETLYTAGEMTEETYESKVEIEKGLARRDSTITVNMGIDFILNGQNLFESMKVNGKKVLSSAKESFETLYGQGTAKVQIISSQKVPDDKTNHDMTIQTTGLEYNTVMAGGKFPYTIDADTGVSALDPKTIFIEVIAPDKTKGGTGSTGTESTVGATTDEAVYTGENTNYCKIKLVKTTNGNKEYTEISSNGVSISEKETNGIISLNVSSGTYKDANGQTVNFDPLDFTYSPLKVKVFYVNPRGKTRSVCTYLYIEPSTLLMSGDTTSGVGIDYYTSAGVESESKDEKDGNGNITGKSNVYTLTAEARAMRTENSVYLTETDSSHYEAKNPVGSPSSRNVSIRSIRWIDNDETAGIEPYYVMVGSEGSIYRMYNFTSDSTPIYMLATATNLSGGSSIFDAANTNNKLHHGTTGYFSGTKTTAKADKVFDLATGERNYPSFWSGDSAHTFEWSSARQRTSYGPSVNHTGGAATWITSVEKEGIVDDPKYNVFSAKAQYAYYFNGDATDHTFNFKDQKVISYVLTERGWPLRLFGVIGEDGTFGLGDFDVFADTSAIWDFENTIVSVNNNDNVYMDASKVLAFHYPSDNSEMQNDYTYSAIRIKGLASYAIFEGIESGEKGYGDYLQVDSGSRSGNDYENAFNMAKLSNTSRLNHDKGNERLVTSSGEYLGDDVEINDVIYIPGVDGAEGSTFYVGTVHAYAHVTQTDRVKDKEYYKGESSSKMEDDYNAGSFFKPDYQTDHDYRGYGYYNYQNTFGTNYCNYPSGTVSDYFILSDQDGRSTWIAMNSGINGTSGEAKSNRVSIAERKAVFKSLNNDYIQKDYVVVNKESGDSITVNGVSGTVYDGTDNSALQTQFFLPEKDSTWSYMKLNDVYFTFGYSSNRSKVYKYITYDGTVEYTRAAERLYWRSHYGQDANYYEETDEGAGGYVASNQSIFSGNALSAHQINRAVSTSRGEMQTGQTYMNSYNNDLYNVWFPGEMYNLTKVATKDGVTVAVGYNVSGSSYQYASTQKTSSYVDGRVTYDISDKYHNTSTALGGIFNDGVMAAMVEGQDDAFVNLLYFKDNGSFDSTSLSNYDQYKEYADMGYGGYGMHRRQSVDFTAVDLVVESQKADEKDESVTLNYYAYYGDSTGRLFKSLVATGTGTDTKVPDENGDTIVTENVKLVSFIKDLTYAGSTPTNTVGEMEEIKVQGQSLSQVFDEILTIDATNDLIIVTGTSTGDRECIVVGQKSSDGNNTWTWKRIYNGNFRGIINDAVIVGGYYYIVGDDFFAGVSLDTLKKLTDGQVIQNTGEGARADGYVDKAYGNDAEDKLLWVPTKIKLYAIDGRDTQ